MHIPSKRVYKEMASEEASIWFVPTLGIGDTAILVKAPTNQLKAIITGCKVEFVFGKNKVNDKNYLCTGFKIHDTPMAGMISCGAQKHAEEHQALKKILSKGSVPVFLFNEMDICVAWTNAKIKLEEAKHIINLLGNLKELYVGKFNSEINHCLDCFEYSLDETQKVKGAYKIDIFSIIPKFENWTQNNIYFLGCYEHNKFQIDDKDEGESFERIIWSSLESVFPLTLHKKPQVIAGDKTRELTDIFCFYPFGTFLIEAKTLSVMEAGYDRTLERKIKGIQKQIKKAISQLIGATKAIKANKIICDSSGKKIEFDRNIIPHCIVLISELYHYGEWTDVEESLLRAMKETEVFFHLLDLREFIRIMKGSSGKPELVDYNLMKRMEIFVKTKNVHIRSRIPPKSSLGIKKRV